VKSTYEDGSIFSLAQYKDGKENGSWVQWYRNGKKMEETIFNNGKILKVLVWKPDGICCPLTNVVNGNGLAVSYDQSGKEQRRSNYRNGEWVKD
jgi:antitoxin component YwqK of YwqJK toxin-antitoxin module